MEWTKKSKRNAQRAAVSLVCSLAAFCYTVPAAHALTANWGQSDLDLWFYTNTDDPGQRFLVPTFANLYSVDPETQQFEPSTVSDTSRLGSALFAFNTSNNITPNLAAQRYQINSVTFTATMTYDGSPKRVQYDNQPISQSALLSQYLPGGSVTSQRPMELYGAGLRAGYTGYEFGSNVSGPPLVDEVTHPYPEPEFGYIAYPIVRNETAPGVFDNVDVMNSVTGGYSETAENNWTTPFTPDPWAIGTANVPVGEDIPSLTTFTFSLDLTKPGVRSYVQESLAAGGLGLFLSSLHSTGVMGTSGGGYPRWFTKEASPFVTPARLPQLAIDYQILPDGLPGDYNGNGVVDAADYVLWRKGGPLLNQVDDPDHVTVQDYVEWRVRFGNTAGSGSGSGLFDSNAVPEPIAILLVALAAPFFAQFRHGRKRR